jgi:transcriptional regulator with XRE-family HTH domain
MPNNDIVALFKRNLVQLRKARGYTQRDLARRMKASQRVVAYYENDAKNIPLTKLQDIADALEVSVVELLAPKKNGKERNLEDLDIRVLRKVRQIQHLPRRAQDAVWHTINATIHKSARTQRRRKQSSAIRDERAK